MQAVGRIVPDMGEADAAWPKAFDLDGAGDRQFSLVAAPRDAGRRAVPGPVIDRGFVDFHQAGQGVAPGIGNIGKSPGAQAGLAR